MVLDLDLPRAVIWKIRIHISDSIDLPLSFNQYIAGFVCVDRITVSLKTIFEDLKIIYPRLNEYREGFKLSLWQQCNGGSIRFRDVDGEDEVFGMNEDDPILELGVIFHKQYDLACGALSNNAKVEEHIRASCAVILDLKPDPTENGYIPDCSVFNIDNGYLPSFIPLANSRFRNPEPTVSDRSELLKEQDRASRSFVQNFNVVTDSFDSYIKANQKKCAITGTNSRWHDLLCGPGYIATHIVPQRHWFTYPDEKPWWAGDTEKFPIYELPSMRPDIETLKKKMRETWGQANGVLLRADISDMWEQRLVAIHPRTRKIRVFAPMGSVMEYHGKDANHIQNELWPDTQALAHHYTQCVIENVAAAPIDKCSKEAREE